jgi:uncharacterized membrane protein
MPSSSTSRLLYIDWMRGLACVLMFQTHCYDSWLGGPGRKTTFFMWSQLGGTVPAPLFLFLAGISFALVVDRLRQRSVTANQIALTTIRRGAEILGFAFLFRLQEYLIALPWAPWTDLLRVDILNTIGISMMLMGLCCWGVLKVSSTGEWKSGGVLAGVLTAVVIALLTPLLWTNWRPKFLPWPIESYLTGVHNLGQPQAWLFPIFPWTGFAFIGLAAGFVLLSNFARRRTGVTILLFGIGGYALITTARWLDHRPTQIYPVYDFWHTSPNFFLMRVGLLLLILFASYAWCRWGLGQWSFSPLIQLGTTSLLVYWVHIEFVYGRVSILAKRSQSIGAASLGLGTVILAMLLLSLARTQWKTRHWRLAIKARPARAV